MSDKERIAELEAQNERLCRQRARAQQAARLWHMRVEECANCAERLLYERDEARAEVERLSGRLATAEELLRSIPIRSRRHRLWADWAAWVEAHFYDEEASDDVSTLHGTALDNALAREVYVNNGQGWLQDHEPSSASLFSQSLEHAVRVAARTGWRLQLCQGCEANWIARLIAADGYSVYGFGEEAAEAICRAALLAARADADRAREDDTTLEEVSE